MNTKRLRLLIVEDEDAHVEAISRAFERAGADVEIRAVGTLREFRACVAERWPDLALVDLNLPDGRAVEILAQPPADMSFPVLVMTAFGNQEIVVEVMKAGALDYVIKSPEAFASMPRTVERAIREWQLLQEHKRMEEHSRILSVMLDIAPSAVTVHDFDGHYLYVNQHALDLHGYREDEFLAINLHQLNVPASAALIAGEMQALRDRGDIAFEAAHFRKDGTTLPLEVHAKLITWAGQQAVLSMATDITVRKQTAEAQARLVLAVEQAAETIIITDPDAKILYANPAFEKITGYTCAEALGRNPRILKSGQHNAEFYSKLWATLTAAQVWKGHLVNKRKDGTFFEENATISPVLDAAGKIINYVAVKRDITREVMLETQNRQAAKMEAVGLLAGGVAHDFNNKLQIILGNVEIILENMPSAHPIQADLEEIRKAARSSADLTRQLLAFSRKQAIEPVVLDMNVAVVSSLKMLGRLVGENIRLNFTASRNDWHVLMDPTQLDQIMTNLSVNARDAIAGTGNIFIEVAHHTLQEADCRDHLDFVPPGDYVVLTFRDDGAGMTPEIQTHIFEPFFTTKGVGHGTGLGLATIYGIIKQNNGAITVHSVPGRGTTFTIYLPRTRAAQSAAADETAERMATGTETVLVVEDEEAILTLIQQTLAKRGYKVLTAVTPRRALEVCARHPEPIHLLLSDVVMPDMDGKELAQRIQKLRPDIRILFMSGYSSENIRQQIGMPTGIPVMHKPFNIVVLTQFVRAVLDGRPSKPPAPCEWDAVRTNG